MLIFIGLLFPFQKSFAQVDYKTLYPFIDTSYNHIVNDTALNSFYKKLEELKEGKRKQLVIVQVGDSHIQADFFSGYLRHRFQKEFGNAGRGLIFPYAVAGSNGPWSYRTSSLTKWSSRRNAIPGTLPIGVAGFTIKTTSAFASININIHDEDSLNYGFNKFTLFADKGPGCYDYVLKDENNQLIGYVNSSDMKQDSFATTICLVDSLHVVNLNTVMTENSQTYAQLYGIYLENSDTGITYSMIGVNGAQYDHYNNSIYFSQQLQQLHPDLVIVSLGTNDAYGKDYKNDYFENQIDEFISELKSRNPSTSFLLTSPPDGYKYHKYKNTNVAPAVNVLQTYAQTHNCAFWNFYNTMGGLGSIYKWYLNHLAQYDLLHLTKTGYELEGQLLYSSLMESFRKHSIK